jgi:UDP:flavonoid glycosyltransferase YjiC (YdhE family)
MLVRPFALDQPANAARVAHHGLGRVLWARDPSAASVAAAIDALVSDEATRARVAAMRAAFVQRLERGEAAAWVESLLSRARRAA